MLEEEVNHLSKCEAECARKDSVISDLREEVESLKKQLDMLRQSSILGVQVTPEYFPYLCHEAGSDHSHSGYEAAEQRVWKSWGTAKQKHFLQEAHHGV